MGVSIPVLAALLPATPLPAGALPAGVPGGAAAHEEAVLKSTVSSVTAGGILPVTGSDFGKNEAYGLRLVGALEEYELVEVDADGEGEFRLELEIPGDVRPGAYQVVAIAPDGDVAARLDVTVLASAAEGADGPARGAADGGGLEHDGARGARADEIRIERSRSGAEWALIGLIVGAAGGLGLGLWRRGGTA